MISPRTKPCRKECPTPKKLEGYCSRRGRQYNPYHDHQLRLQYTTIEERTQPTGAYISYTTYFLFNFLLNYYSLRDPIYICPRFFIFATPFRDSHSRPTFVTPFRDSHSRPTFATHIRDSFFATHVRDYTSYSHSQLAFATTLATPDCAPDRNSLFLHDFRHATPPLTDGLCQHPSVISLAFQP